MNQKNGIKFEIVAMVVGVLLLLFGGVHSADANSQDRPPNAVAVYCDMEETDPGTSDLLVCRRADTRASVTPVPNGQFLFLTDVVVNRANALTSGDHFATIGLDDGDNIPTFPRFNFSGEFPDQSIHFNSPYLVLHAGEQARIYNSSVSSRSIEVFVSGYMAPDVVSSPTAIQGMSMAIGQPSITQLGFLMLLGGLIFLTYRQQRLKP